MEDSKKLAFCFETLSTEVKKRRKKYEPVKEASLNSSRMISVSNLMDCAKHSNGFFYRPSSRALKECFKVFERGETEEVPKILSFMSSWGSQDQKKFLGILLVKLENVEFERAKYVLSKLSESLEEIVEENVLQNFKRELKIFLTGSGSLQLANDDNEIFFCEVDGPS